MKKALFIFAAIVMMAGASTRVNAEDTEATVTGTTAGAKLIVPMTLTQTSPLHFGTINVQAGVAGTVILPSNSTTRVFDGGVIASTVAPLATNAAYDVTGTMNVTYALVLPPTITLTETVGSTETMTISDLTARFANNPGDDDVVSTLDADGEDSFTVGGTLTVPEGQAGGIYYGTFNVSVDYN